MDRKRNRDETDDLVSFKRLRDSLQSPKFWNKLDKGDQELAPVRIKDVQMVVLSEQDIRKLSVCPIQTTTLYEKSLPRAYGINDIRMGTVDRKLRCGTCNNGMLICNGHMGHIELPMPVYHISYISDIVKLFRCVCPRCLRLVASSEDSTFSRIMVRLGEHSKQRYTTLCNYLKNKKACGHKDCGFILPKYSQHGFVIKREWSAQSKRQFTPEVEQEVYNKKNSQKKSITAIEIKKRKMCDSHVVQKVSKNTGKKSTVSKYVPGGDTYMKAFSPKIAQELLEMIDDKVYTTLGLNPEKTHPSSFVLDVLVVPPPIIRPSIMFSESSRTRGQDDLTHKLQEILKQCQKLTKCIEEDATDMASSFELLQTLVASYMNNESAGTKVQSKKRSGLPEKCVVKRFKGKKGRFRGNLMGKRVDFSSRTVISPDSVMDADQIGIPHAAALKLTFVDTVTSYNIARLRERVRKGSGVIDGAKSITKHNGQQISLEMCKNRGNIRLQMGWSVERYMQDGDTVLFNRQPSLRKKSIMAHSVVLMPGRTFRLNLSCTGPYNGDFDGDEMNMHMLQSTEAVVEAKLLMGVGTQLLNAQNNKPCMGIVQDALVGAFLLTKKDCFLNQGEISQLMMHIKYPKSTCMPIPAILKPERLWTGKQVMSLIIPDISLSKKTDHDEDVFIKHGELLTGRLCKKTLGATSGGIIHVTCKMLDSQVALHFMSDCQRVINVWMEGYGFSVGVSDCITDQKTRVNITRAVDSCLGHIERVTTMSKSLSIPFAYREGHVSKILSKMLNVTGGLVQDQMAQDNALMAMVKSGSKGNPINISQISGCVGQQSVEGHRIFDGDSPQDRTLACYPNGCDDAPSRGFVRNSYIQGLTAEEVFFHTMGGREGIVDTSVKTVHTHTHTHTHTDIQIYRYTYTYTYTQIGGYWISSTQDNEGTGGDQHPI
jgi:DNA-directed RNA polymerase II subunit RPB1